MVIVAALVFSFLFVACGQMPLPPAPSTSTHHDFGLAGNEVGNGGVALNCMRDGQSTLDLLDFAPDGGSPVTRIYPWDGISFGSGVRLFTEVKSHDGNLPGMAFRADFHQLLNDQARNGVMEWALRRLALVDLERAIRYRRGYANLLLHAELTHERFLSDTSDYGNLTIPGNCRIEQVIVERDGANGPHYLINQDLWFSLHAVDQAGLIFHELVYADARRRGHRTSVATRAFVQWLFSDIIGNDVTWSLVPLTPTQSVSYPAMLEALSLDAGSRAIRPTWRGAPASQPLNLPKACAGYPYSLELGRWAEDPAMRALGFAATGLPDWLRLSSDGTLYGRAPAQAGTHFFDVSATSPAGSARARLSLLVSDRCQDPEWAASPLIFSVGSGDALQLELGDQWHRSGYFHLRTGLPGLTLRPDGHLQLRVESLGSLTDALTFDFTPAMETAPVESMAVVLKVEASSAPVLLCRNDSYEVRVERLGTIGSLKYLTTLTRGGETLSRLTQGTLGRNGFRLYFAHGGKLIGSPTNQRHSYPAALSMPTGGDEKPKTSLITCVLPGADS